MFLENILALVYQQYMYKQTILDTTDVWIIMQLNQFTLEIMDLITGNCFGINNIAIDKILGPFPTSLNDIENA